jgi:hypothetical protein
MVGSQFNIKKYFPIDKMCADDVVCSSQGLNSFNEYVTNIIESKSVTISNSPMILWYCSPIADMSSAD